MRKRKSFVSGIIYFTHLQENIQKTEFGNMNVLNCTSYQEFSIVLQKLKVQGLQKMHILHECSCRQSISHPHAHDTLSCTGLVKWSHSKISQTAPSINFIQITLRHLWSFPHLCMNNTWAQRRSRISVQQIPKCYSLLLQSCDWSELS